MSEKICPNPKCYSDFWYKFIQLAYGQREKNADPYSLEIENGDLGCKCRFSPCKAGEKWERIDEKNI